MSITVSSLDAANVDIATIETSSARRSIGRAIQCHNGTVNYTTTDISEIKEVDYTKFTSVANPNVSSDGVTMTTSGIYVTDSDIYKRRLYQISLINFVDSTILNVRSYSLLKFRQQKRSQELPEKKIERFSIDDTRQDNLFVTFTTKKKIVMRRTTVYIAKEDLPQLTDSNLVIHCEGFDKPTRTVAKRHIGVILSMMSRETVNYSFLRLETDLFLDKEKDDKEVIMNSETD